MGQRNRKLATIDKPECAMLIAAEVEQSQLMQDFGQTQRGRAGRHMSDPCETQRHLYNPVIFHSVHDATAEGDLCSRSRRRTISHTLLTTAKRFSKRVRHRVLHSMALFHDDVCGMNWVTAHNILDPVKKDMRHYDILLRQRSNTHSVSCNDQRRRRMYFLDEPTTRQVTARMVSNQLRINQDGTPRSFSSPVRNHTCLDALSTLQHTSDGVNEADRNTSFASVISKNLLRSRSCDSNEHFHRSDDSGMSIGTDRLSGGWHLKHIVQGRLSEENQEAKHDQNSASAVSPKQSDVKQNVPSVGQPSTATLSDVSAPFGMDGVHDRSSHGMPNHHSGVVQRRRKLGVVQRDVDGEWIISRQHYDPEALGKAIQRCYLEVMQNSRRSHSLQSERDSNDEDDSLSTPCSQSQDRLKSCSGTRTSNLFAKLCPSARVR